MLDSRSLEVISRFKLAVLTRANGKSRSADLPTSNRGKKLPASAARNHALTAKVVEYDNLNHLVLTNDVIERTNYRNKRRWKDFYGGESERYSELSDQELGSDSEEAGSGDEDDENPLKRLKISDILAPLAHPSELVTHPAISKTFRLNCFSTMAADLIQLIETEQNTLNDLNKLLQVLDGEDWFYLLEENMGLPEYDHGLDETVTARKKAQEKAQQEEAQSEPKEEQKEDDRNENKRITRMASATPDNDVTDPFFALPRTLAMYEAAQQKQLEELHEDGDELDNVQRDLVNYLQVSIQRQHEYIKNLTTIRNGVVKSDRYKRDLLKWGREMQEKKS